MVGMLGDRVKLRAAMTVVFLSIAYILSVGILLRPQRHDTVDRT